MRVTGVDAPQTINTVEEICHHHVLRQGLSGTDSYNRLSRIQGLEALRSALVLPPCSFFADKVEQGDNIS